MHRKLRITHCAFLVALLLLLAPGPASAQRGGGQELAPIGHLSHYVSSLAARPPYLYVGLPGEFAIYDVADPAAAVRVGYVILPSRDYGSAYVYDLAYAGDYVYLAADALYVIDASDPQRPRQVAMLDPERVDTLRKVVVQGNRVYAQSSNNQLLVIDVSDPLAPQLVTMTAVQGEPWRGNLAANDRTLFVSAGHLIHMYDITGGDLTEIGVYPQAAGDGQLAVLGNVLFVADGWNGLVILDVSTPAQPRQIGHYLPLHAVEQVTVSGSYAVAGMASGPTEVLDISTPEAPIPLASLGADITARLLLHENRLYTYNWTAGLQVYDLTDPTQPRQIGGLLPPFSSTGLVSDGRYLYSVDSQGKYVSVVDGQDPTNPRLVTRIPGSGERLAVSGSLLFNGGEGIRVLDISDATHIRALGYVDPNPSVTTTFLFDLLAEGVYVYTVDRDTLYVIDASDPAHPFVAGRLPDLQIIGGAYLAKQGNRLYVATAQSGVHVIDVSNPAQPWRMATWLQPQSDDQGYISAVAVNGPYLYLGWAYGAAPDRYMGLIVLDGSLVHAPREVAWISMLSRVNTIHVYGDYVYVGFDQRSYQRQAVVVLDASTPWLPVQVATAPARGDLGSGLAVQDNGLFLNDLSELVVYPLPTDLHATRLFLPILANE